MSGLLRELVAAAEQLAALEGKSLRDFCIESAWGLAFTIVLTAELAVLVIMLQEVGCP